MTENCALALPYYAMGPVETLILQQKRPSAGEPNGRQHLSGLWRDHRPDRDDRFRLHRARHAAADRAPLQV
nr:hypothetical protein SHINE37_43098 [Rhizobiaceae bacterium]